MILFGSHAAGHAQAWSDIDIAVISPKFDTLPLLERYEQLGLANRELRAPLDVVGFSLSQVASCEPGSFLAEILRTGITISLWQRRSIVSQRKGQNRAR